MNDCFVYSSTVLNLSEGFISVHLLYILQLFGNIGRQNSVFNKIPKDRYLSMERKNQIHTQGQHSHEGRKNCRAEWLSCSILQH